MCNIKPMWNKNFTRQKVNKKRKFHTPLDHFAPTLGCIHLPTPHFRDYCSKQDFVRDFYLEIEC